MAVVKNLMIRIGADYSPAKKSMDGATRELTKFRHETEKTTAAIKGQRGLGGIASEYKILSRELTSSISRLKGAHGIGGVSAGLGSLVPLLGRSAGAMRGFGGAAAGAGAELAAVAGPIGIVAAALTALAAVSAVASQEAIKFESTIGRVNMQLKGGSRAYMDWARSQGLAKQTAADLGATYSTILSSFISDNKDLQMQTKQVVQATRILVSGTGRPIEEVLERVRSGLLGNTEAIEDLGVFVNVAMIESTQAFKKFANGKSWDQLDFRVQQQIRLAAILEQTYARYGNELQNNTMTKQSLLIEQLKDIKLNLSQAFLPIWDAVLPALTRLAEGIAGITENIARFMYSLRNLDYDEMTRGTDGQTDAVNNQGKSYDDLAKSVKKARNELAGFDELNLIGDPGTGTGGGGGGTGGPPLPDFSNPGGGGGPGDNLDIPPLPRMHLEFDPPRPPDAGAGAVAAAVINTVNGLVAETRKSFSDMWKSLSDEAGVDAPALRGAIAAAFAGIAAGAALSTGQVTVSWATMLQGMLGDLNVYKPQIELGWTGLNLKIASIKSPLADVRLDWHETLDYMQKQLNAYRPYLDYGWQLIALAVRKSIAPLADLKTAWYTTLDDMLQRLNSNVSSMVAEFQRLRAEAAKPIHVAQPQTSPAPSSQPIYSPAAVAARNTAVTQPAAASVPKETFVSSLQQGFASTFSGENLTGMLNLIQTEANKPENKTAFQVYTSLLSGGQLLKYLGAVKTLKNVWQGLAGAIPAFGTGGMVFGPTLATVGDNPGARSDPEVIAPLSDLEGMMGGDDGEIVDVLRQILQAVREGKSVQAVIAESDIGRAAINHINGQTRRGRNPLTI